MLLGVVFLAVLLGVLDLVVGLVVDLVVDDGFFVVLVRGVDATSVGREVVRLVSRGVEAIGVEPAGGCSAAAIIGGSSIAGAERVPGLLHLVGSSAHFST